MVKSIAVQIIIDCNLLLFYLLFCSLQQSKNAHLENVMYEFAFTLSCSVEIR